jgi:hypothetical protein
MAIRDFLRKIRLEPGADGSYEVQPTVLVRLPYQGYAG